MLKLLRVLLCTWLANKYNGQAEHSMCIFEHLKCCKDACQVGIPKQE